METYANMIGIDRILMFHDIHNMFFNGQGLASELPFKILQHPQLWLPRVKPDHKKLPTQSLPYSCHVKVSHPCYVASAKIAPTNRLL